MAPLDRNPGMLEIGIVKMHVNVRVIGHLLPESTPQNEYWITSLSWVLQRGIDNITTSEDTNTITYQTRNHKMMVMMRTMMKIIMIVILIVITTIRTFLEQAGQVIYQ